MVGTGARATGAAQTFIHISSTARTSKAIEARTGKGTHPVLAGAAIEAWVCSEPGRNLVIPRAHVSCPCPSNALHGGRLRKKPERTVLSVCLLGLAMTGLEFNMYMRLALNSDMSLHSVF